MRQYQPKHEYPFPLKKNALDNVHHPMGGRYQKKTENFDGYGGVRLEPGTKEYIVVGMRPNDLRPPSYWYREHEVQNERDRSLPKTTVQNAALLYNLQRQNEPVLLNKMQEKMLKAEEQIALQLKAEFMRPKAVVFDSAGNFYRTRVDEQSWL